MRRLNDRQAGAQEGEHSRDRNRVLHVDGGKEDEEESILTIVSCWWWRWRWGGWTDILGFVSNSREAV